MQPDEYLEWQSEAARLVAEWEMSHCLPRIDEPRAARWESKDGLESHTIFVWSGNAYSPGAHFQRIYEGIGESISADRVRWGFQSAFYAKAFAKFFQPEDDCYPLNAVLVTPSRVPMNHWARCVVGRQPMQEKHDRWKRESVNRSKGIPFAFQEFSIPLEIELEGIAWADFEFRRLDRFALTSMWTPRAWGRWDIRVLRLFQADPNSSDILALNAGAIPAMRDPRIIGTTPGRVDLSMVQLLRLKHDGEGDLLLFEVMRGSGLMVDIRFSRQGLDSIMMPDPYFAPAFRRAIHHGKKL